MRRANLNLKSAREFVSKPNIFVLTHALMRDSQDVVYEDYRFVRNDKREKGQTSTDGIRSS